MAEGGSGWTFRKALVGQNTKERRQKKLAGLKGWQLASKVRVEEIKGQEDFNKRIVNAGENLVVIYNYCAADRELLPYISALSKEHPKVIFLKNNMDDSFLKDLTDAPCVYFYSLQQKVEECAVDASQKQRIKESVVKYSKPSTVVLLRKLRKLKQIQQTTRFDSLETKELIEAFRQQKVDKKLNYVQFRNVLLGILKSKGLATQATGLTTVKDGLRSVSSELLQLVSTKYEVADKQLDGPEKERVEQEARILEGIFQKLVDVDYNLDIEMCKHLNCGVEENNKYTLSLDALEQIFSHLYQLFAQLDNHGEVDVEEFVAMLSIFCKGTLMEKLVRVFSFIDNNHDNHLSEAELVKYLKAIHTIVLALEPSCRRGNKLISKLAKEMFAEMDTDNDGKVTYLDFESFVLNSKYKHIFAWMSVFQPTPVSSHSEDDEQASLNVAGNLFLELIDTFAPTAQPTSTKPHHTGTQCDSCNQNPIIGTRYYCMDCEERDEKGTYTGGYDLCENCFKKAKELQKEQGQHVHPLDHEFIELTEPESGQELDACKIM